MIAALFVLFWLASIAAAIYGLLLVILKKDRRAKGVKILKYSVGVFIAMPIAIALTAEPVKTDVQAASDTLPAITEPVAVKQVEVQSEVTPTVDSQNDVVAIEREASVVRHPIPPPPSVISAAEKAREEEIKKLAEEAKLRTGEHCFSPWDGSHIVLGRAVKENLRNPRSYEHVETRFGRRKDTDENMSLIMTYRGENGFGGMNVERISATFDPITCLIIDIKEEH